MVYQTEFKQVAEKTAAELTELNPGWLFVVDQTGINYKTGQWCIDLADCPFSIKKFRPWRAGYKCEGHFTWKENTAHTMKMYKKYCEELLA